MLLAFIYNPLQTFSIYSVLVIYILCGYLFIWTLLQIPTLCTPKKEYEINGSNANDVTNNPFKFFYLLLGLFLFLL